MPLLKHDCPHAFHISALAGDQAQTFLKPSPMPSPPGAPVNPECSLPSPNGFPLCESVLSLPNETKLPREGPGLLPDVPHRASMVRAAKLLTGATTDGAVCGFILLWAPFQMASQQPS